MCNCRKNFKVEKTFLEYSTRFIKKSSKIFYSWVVFNFMTKCDTSTKYFM